MTRNMAVLALALGVAAVPAGAHEKGDRALGVVESVTAERIVVKASDGHSISFAITPDTRFSQGEKPATPEDVRVGQRTVVEGKRGTGGLEAVRVKLGAR
jgi:hypothetical protein